LKCGIILIIFFLAGQMPLPIKNIKNYITLDIYCYLQLHN
jgi:hypothetical protein